MHMSCFMKEFRTPQRGDVIPTKREYEYNVERVLICTYIKQKNDNIYTYDIIHT